MVLVMHVSSSVSDEGMRCASRAGVTKINVSARLNVVFAAVVREYLMDNGSVVCPHHYTHAANEAVRPEAGRLLLWYAGQ